MTNQINQLATPSVTLSVMISEVVYQLVLSVERVATWFARREGKTCAAATQSR
ncbi:MAG: hypothetical protein AAF441_19875 [Pseudomonadota bacterium]